MIGSRKISSVPARETWIGHRALTDRVDEAFVLGRLADDPQQQRGSPFEAAEGLETHRRLGTGPTDEPLDLAGGQDDGGVAGLGRGGPLGSDHRGRHERHPGRPQLNGSPVSQSPYDAHGPDRSLRRSFIDGSRCRWARPDAGFQPWRLPTPLEGPSANAVRGNGREGSGLGDGRGGSEIGAPGRVRPTAASSRWRRCRPGTAAGPAATRPHRPAVREDCATIRPRSVLPIGSG